MGRKETKSILVHVKLVWNNIVRPPSSKPKSSKRENDEVHRHRSRKRCILRELETHPLSPQRSTNSGLIKLSQHSKRTRHLSGLQSRGNRRYRADGITNRRSRGKLETEAFRDTTDVLLSKVWVGGERGKISRTNRALFSTVTARIF